MNQSPYYRKRVQRFEMAVEHIIARHGYECCGVLTLTFPENLQDWDEAERRFRSFQRGILDKHCRDWALVVQYQERGAIHYHLVVGLCVDIRTGTNMEVLCNRNLPGYVRYGHNVVSDNLRHVWDVICQRAAGKERDPATGRFIAVSDGYGLGRCELLPFKKPVQAVARYLAAYLKVLPRPEHKHKKRVRYSQAVCNAVRPNFASAGFGGFIFREKLRWIASDLGCADIEELSGFIGPNWYFELRDCLTVHPLSKFVRKVDWQRGTGRKVIGVLVERLAEERHPAFEAYRFELGRLFERLGGRCREPDVGPDPDWFVPQYAKLTEWQLGLLLFNYERQGGEKERSLPASAFGDCSRVG